MSKMIPGIGRKVWFWPEGQAEGIQAHDATIVFVHDERTVNLRCSDHSGQSYTERRVTLVDLEATDQLVPVQGYATWMPYQIGQAKKDSEAEAKTKSPVSPANAVATVLGLPGAGPVVVIPPVVTKP